MTEPQPPSRETEPILFLEHIAGIAGDMFTAACINAGVVSAEEIREIPGLLGFTNSTVRINVSDLMTANLNATHVDIHWDEEAVEKLGEDRHSEDHHHITYQKIDELIRDSELSGEAKKYARQIIYLLGNAEAKVHNVDIEKVAFHEIGDIDSVLDVVMAGYCIAAISPGRVYSSPVKLGRGTVEIRHGSYPIPPPASAILSEGCSLDPVPASIRQPNVELSTPTGLAILKALSPVFIDQWPTGTVRHQGVGAGSGDLGKYPNVFRVVILEGEKKAPDEELPYKYGEVMEIVCNVDDQTPERTAWILEQLLELGAVDAWLTPLTGKKNRLGTMISALVEPSQWTDIADWLLRHSSTFGLRYRRYKRLELLRMSESRDTPHGKVNYKMGFTTEGEKLKEKPEFDDLRQIWKDHPDYEGE